MILATASFVGLVVAGIAGLLHASSWFLILYVLASLAFVLPLRPKPNQKQQG